MKPKLFELYFLKFGVCFDKEVYVSAVEKLIGYILYAYIEKYYDIDDYEDYISCYLLSDTGFDTVFVVKCSGYAKVREPDDDGWEEPETYDFYSILIEMVEDGEINEIMEKAIEKFNKWYDFGVKVKEVVLFDDDKRIILYKKQ